MKKLRKIFFKVFKFYRRLELKYIAYPEADELIRDNYGKPDEEKWILALEEDNNHMYGMVYLERRERITE